jgi:hypothetical protein
MQQLYLGNDKLKKQTHVHTLTAELDRLSFKWELCKTVDL